MRPSSVAPAEKDGGDERNLDRRRRKGGREGGRRVRMRAKGGREGGKETYLK